MTELTRNESAGLLENIVGHLIARAPESTAHIAKSGVGSFLAGVRGDELHIQHFGWLMERLSKQDVVDEIDKFAATMRAAGSKTDVPWRD